MFKAGYSADKLDNGLKHTSNSLKLMRKEKTEKAQKARREVADYLLNGKADEARIRVKDMVSEEDQEQAIELIGSYCDRLQAHFKLIEITSTFEQRLKKSIASLIWVAPLMSRDVPELQVISDQFRGKYGKEFFEICVADRENWVDLRLKQKMSVEAPAASLVEKYLIEIAQSHNVPYVPRPMAFNGEDMEPLLNDMDDKGKPPSGPSGGPSGGGGGGGGMPMAQMLSAPPKQPQAQAPTPYPPAVHPGMAYPFQHLKQKMSWSVKAPAPSLVENHVVEIARSHNVPSDSSPKAFNWSCMVIKIMVLMIIIIIAIGVMLLVILMT